MAHVVSRRALLVWLGAAPIYMATAGWALGEQAGWRWCRKCQGLWFGGNNTGGACPAGGGHDGTGSGNYRLLHNSPGAPGQHAWRWCRKCQGLWYSGGQGEGACPAGGVHLKTGSGNYALASDGAQSNWRWCHKCQGLWFAGNPDQGACPADGGHSASGSVVYALNIGDAPILGDDDLLGIWSAQARTKGGLGAQFTFVRGGEVIFTFGALVDFKYEINGNRVITTSGEPDKAEQSTEVFAIDSNTLQLTSAIPQGPSVTRALTRVGDPYPDVHPIVGAWRGPYPPTHGEATTRYSRTGSGQLSVPFQTRMGTYRAGTAPRVDFGGSAGSGVTLKRDGELLITRNAEGKEGTFRRFEY
jgi:hypothetical protein